MLFTLLVLKINNSQQNKFEEGIYRQIKKRDENLKIAPLKSFLANIDPSLFNHMTQVTLFTATWNKESSAAKELLIRLNVPFQVVDVEEESGKAVAKKYSVSRIPSILFINNTTESEERSRLTGYDPQEFSKAFSPGTLKCPSSLEDRMKTLINSSKLMIFIKGTPEAPKCGFTVQLITLLKQNNVNDYGSFDILSDEQIRQSLKEFSKWPTYPQIYFKGELIGGLDIVKEMFADGSFTELIKN
jgi:Grx4 family monothiol glutaredoxin